MSDRRLDFFNTMVELADADPTVRLLVGDLGYSFMEGFAKKHPDKFINMGICEQNMVGVASGMARAGLKPYCYSGAIFILMRAYEQVRDDVCYNNTNVKLVGTGASGFLGFTHNMNEDENEEDLLKNLPNIKRYYPENVIDIREALTTDGPAYIRL